VSKKRTVYIGLSITLSVVLIAYLFSQIKAHDLAQTLGHLYWPALFIYIGISLISAWLRAWRYKWLLRPQAISWRDMFLVTFIRNAFDDLLPARIGSLSYIYVLNKRLDFSFESAASTFVVAFVLDFLTLSPFLVLAVLAVGFGTATIPIPALLAFALGFFLLIFVVLWKIVPVSRFFLKIYQALLKILKADQKIKARVSVDKLQATIESLREFQKRRIYAPLYLLSLVIRLGKYISLYVLLFALLRSHGFGLQDISFWKTILGITGAELTSALPVKGIADFGTWESAWALAFQLMRFDAKLAILSGIGIHLITNLFEYGLGFLSVLILAVPFLQKARSVRSPSKKSH
jgi:uncharacterized membrane protein YbhN (UPF0104 family)